MWYRHSPPLAPFGSTNCARSCNAPHLGLEGKGVLLTWQQGHQLPKSQNAGTKKKPKHLATFLWVSRNQYQGLPQKNLPAIPNQDNKLIELELFFAEPLGKWRFFVNQLMTLVGLNSRAFQWRPFHVRSENGNKKWHEAAGMFHYKKPGQRREFTWCIYIYKYVQMIHVCICTYSFYMYIYIYEPKVSICICLWVENRRNQTAKQSQNLCATERTFSLSQKLPWYCAYWAIHDYGDTILQNFLICTFAVFFCTITMWYLREHGGMASVGCDTFRHLESICWKCCAINRLLEAHADKIDSCCNVTKKYVPSADKVRQKQRPDAVP